MSADNMPPLPKDEALDRALSAFATACVYRGHAERMSAAAAVHEVARAYADAQVRELVEALARAEQFIANGIELGYIRMPDADTPDTAHETPKILRALIAKHRKEQA